MTEYGDFAEYLRTERTAWHGSIMGRLAAAQAVQATRGNTAPVISGSGSYSGSGGGGVQRSNNSYSTTSSSYAGNLNFKGLKKGHVNPVTGRLSQGWGKSNIKYAAGRHTGYDYGVKQGTRVGAAASGVVVRAGGEGAYGNAIHIKHPDGKTTLYAHLSSIGVKAGQKVNVGQQIGKSGATGRAFGAHLHFEVRGSDRYGGDINPSKW